MATAKEVMSMRLVQPVLLVRAYRPRTETFHGLVIPDTARDRPRCGEVLRVGEGCAWAPEVGATVWFGRYSATPLWDEVEGYHGDPTEETDPDFMYLAPRWVQFYTDGDEIVPANDFMFIVEEDNEPRKVGHLHLPDIAIRPPCYGIVAQVGPGRMSKSGKRLPMDIAAGDRVAFKYYTSLFTVEVNGERFIVANEADIYARLEDESEAAG